MKFKKADVCEPLFSTSSFWRPDSILFSSSNGFKMSFFHELTASLSLASGLYVEIFFLVTGANQV